MTKLYSVRLCSSCGKLLGEHKPAQLEECFKIAYIATHSVAEYKEFEL